MRSDARRDRRVLKQRHQFGVPLSSFQALQHRMAEMYVELELLRSMAYLAAMTLETSATPSLENGASRRRRRKLQNPAVSSANKRFSCTAASA